MGIVYIRNNTIYFNGCTKDAKNVIIHYGVLGMKWGVRKAYFKTGNMSTDEYARACDLWRRIPEFPGLSKSEKEWVYENFDNNLTADEKSYSIVSRRFDNHEYTAINKGHNEYKIINRERKEGRNSWEEDLAEILEEVVGKDWRKYDY